MHYVNDTRKVPLNRNNTIIYDIADAMFVSVYQQHFDDIVAQWGGWWNAYIYFHYGY